MDRRREMCVATPAAQVDASGGRGAIMLDREETISELILRKKKRDRAQRPVEQLPHIATSGFRRN